VHLDAHADSGGCSAASRHRTPGYDRLPLRGRSRQQLGNNSSTAQQLSAAGLADTGHRLADAAQAAFMHSLTGACWVAAGVAASGALLVAVWLPARPRAGQPQPTAGSALQPVDGLGRRES
jgi:hypothetical protein